MEDAFASEPWPCRNELKRQAPGLAVRGRRWQNQHIDALPYLIGQIVEDARHKGDTILIEISGRCDVTDIDCIDLELIGVSNELPEVYGFNWGVFEKYVKAYVRFNTDQSGRIHPLRFHCNDEGDFWEDFPPRYVHYVDC